MRRGKLAAALLVLAGGCGTASGQSFVGPSHYFSIKDSPIYGQLGTPEFFLQDFEHVAPEMRGVSIDHGHVRGPGRGTNSVDGDDGKIDGLGRRGRAWYFARGRQGVTIRFDENILGELPTFAGLVWTDGSAKARVTFEAFDGDGELILRELIQPMADKWPRGGTVEDHLLAAEYEGGISAIRVSNSRGAIQLDHVQYGGAVAAVPEPGSVALLAMGGALLLRRRRA